MSLYVLYDGAADWARVSFAKRVDGAQYRANFNQDTAAASYYSLPQDMIVTDLPTADWAYHFWSARHAITGTIVGLVAAFDARLTVGLAGTVLAQTGCDFKAADFTNISDAWVGSMRPVTATMQTFYGSTLSLAELQAAPKLPFVLERL